MTSLSILLVTVKREYLVVAASVLNKDYILFEKEYVYTENIMYISDIYSSVYCSKSGGFSKRDRQ